MKKDSFEKMLVEATREVAYINAFLKKRMKSEGFKDEEDKKLADKLTTQVSKLLDDLVTASLSANELMSRIKSHQIKRIGELPVYVE